MILDRVCAECKSTETKMGEFKGYGALFKKKAVVTNSPVDACFCLNCGYILFLKVRNPEKFLKFNMSYSTNGCFSKKTGKNELGNKFLGSFSIQNQPLTLTKPK